MNRKKEGGGGEGGEKEKCASDLVVFIACCVALAGDGYVSMETMHQPLWFAFGVGQ